MSFSDTGKRKVRQGSPLQGYPDCDIGHRSRPAVRMRTDEGSSDLHIDKSRFVTPDTRARHKPITTIDWRAELCRVLEQPIYSLDEHILDKLESSLNELRERRRLELITDDTRAASPRYQVLYRIKCGHSASWPIAYEQPPWVVEAGPYNAHLRGSNPISNLELYLERNKDIAFLVYADFECCSGGPKEPLNRQVEFFPIDSDVMSLLKQESIVLVSENMEEALCELAESALEGIPHPTFELSKEVDIVFPYLWWFYRRDKISETISQLDNQSQLYLSVLQCYISERLEKEWQKVDDLISKRRITHKYLHYIFAPGQILFSQLKGGHESQVEGFQSSSWLEPGHRSINVLHWSFDGSFRQLRTHLVLPARITYEVEFDITSLSFYPRKFADEKLANSLLNRGRLFWKCRRRNYVYHNEFAGDGTQSSSDARFMVDMETYKNMHPKEHNQVAPPDDIAVSTVSEDLMDQDEPHLGEEFFMCLPTHINGFNMQKKEWVKLQVYYLEDVKWNTKAFDYLVINKSTKELITAVVMNQLGGQANADLIRGKGNGLFMLLHGGPGTGKTLTAESVAEIAKKPLYRVTCGDIGTKAEDVERYLEGVLYLGKTWGCVVLLDEADVFLEQRSLLNLERNALVSVFLRVLEYYDGILILTSNRVGIFDEAFKSRIQLSLRYEKLGQKERYQIWQNFICHLDTFQQTILENSTSESERVSTIGYGINISDLKANLEELSQADLNGREIRNALSTARQLALYRKELLQHCHLKDVMYEARKFDEYLKELRDGYTEDDIQRERRER